MRDYEVVMIPTWDSLETFRAAVDRKVLNQ